MAVYDGFFDAVMDDETGEYDRTYESGDFTEYFSNIIGTGVCVHNDPDSFKVRLEEGRALVSPGHLFIRGYWLKNDADYPIDLPGTGNYAIVAHLNLGKRMIELEARSVAQAYPDSLVLAIVSPAAAEDTRHNTDICGVIDTAGELSKKVEWAVNYIDTEIESKLDQVEQDINAQAAKLDAKIAEVQAVADSIVPPPIGSIKFSASQDVGEEWLRCDGSFINETQYPELVAALGKLIPSGDKFQLISSGEVGPQITNGVVYGGRLWVYSYSTKKLYGVDLEGTAAVKEIALTSEDEHFNDFLAPTPQVPIALSIVPHTTGSGAVLFLAQVIRENPASVPSEPVEMSGYMLIFSAELAEEKSSLLVERPVKMVDILTNNYGATSWVAFKKDNVPYVISKQLNGKETYYCQCCGKYSAVSGSSISRPIYPDAIIMWTTESEIAEFSTAFSGYFSKFFPMNQRSGFSTKTQKESVFVSSGSNAKYSIFSALDGTFSRSEGTASYSVFEARTTKIPMNIAGSETVITDITTSTILAAGRVKDRFENVNVGVNLPSAARIFVDGGAYLWGKDIYMIFVGTGIIFSRDLTEGSFGYLDTTSVLGVITQFGYLDYSEDEGTLYLLGQDTTNTVKVAKIVLNTLYDYANDGAWLPMIASDGVPAYIKAKEAE